MASQLIVINMFPVENKFAMPSSVLGLWTDNDNVESIDRNEDTNERTVDIKKCSRGL